MKIGITCHPSAGGSGILATELGMALADRGHVIHFVTHDMPFRLKDFHTNIFCHFVQPAAYPLFRHPPSSLALANKIAEIAEEHSIELWHAHYAIPNAASAIIARDMLPQENRFKLVTTLHGTDITLVGSDPSFFRMTKYAIEGSDAVTAVSNWLNEETHREFRCKRDIRTIYNFLDPKKFNSKEPECCNLADASEKVVMHISNFRPVKRVTDVIRTFKKISDHMPAKLVLLGDGPERMSAIGVAKQLGIIDKITHLGNIENIESVIPCADLVFQPSEHESFGIVPLEAMACGIPVLGTASGGVCEVVDHGKTGFLCEVGDIESMAKHAIEVLENDDRAKEMGRRAQARVKEFFSQDIIVKQYEDLYKEILSNTTDKS